MLLNSQKKVFRATAVLGFCFHLRATKIRLSWNDERFFLQVIIQRNFFLKL